MLQPADIRKFCEKKYSHFLASLASGDSFFPLDVPFGRLGARFEHAEISRTVSALAECRLGYQIEWRLHTFRLLGEQRVPKRIWFETPEDYLRAVGKQREVQCFIAAVALTRRECPKLVQWIAKNPLKTVQYLDCWPEVLKVVVYFLHNPRPNLYARELPIDVPTKFIEENTALLDAVLQAALPASAINANEDSFYRRIGLRCDEPLIRFRLLDDALRDRLGLPFSDMSVPISQIAKEPWNDRNILIVENKLTFLTLPPISNAIAIWGAGAAAQNLVRLPFLRGCRLFYWGDLDTHGFHIVSRLRGTFRDLKTIMMDISTLEVHKTFVVKASEGKYEDTLMLTTNEHATYRHLELTGLLLEQERIPLSYATPRLLSAIASACVPGSTRGGKNE